MYNNTRVPQVREVKVQTEYGRIMEWLERSEAGMRKSDPEGPEYHAYCEEYQHCLELIEREGENND